MNAKEMFEELGYQLVDVEVNDVLLRYKMPYEMADDIIDFTINGVTFECDLEENDAFTYGIPKSILKAIAQQMLELGWLD